MNYSNHGVGASPVRAGFGEGSGPAFTHGEGGSPAADLLGHGVGTVHE